MSVNDILLTDIGEPGLYQFLLLFWAALCCALTAMQSLVMIFTQDQMGFRCADADEFNNSKILNYTQNVTQHQYGVCTRGETNTTCQSFEYNSTLYRSTIISRFDLVCSNENFHSIPYITLLNIMFMLTRIPGGFVTGQFIDRAGRKVTIIVGLLLLSAFGLGAAYAVNIAMYISFRCLLSLPIMAVYDSCATLISEVTTPSKRPHMLIGLIFSWGTGIILLSAVGYWLREWQQFQMAISLPSILLCVTAYWVFDESPHWLFSQKRYTEAQRVIDKIARWNKCSPKNIEIPEKDNSKKYSNYEEDSSKLQLHNGTDNFHENLAAEESRGSGCLKILKTPRFLSTLSIVAFGWLSCNMAYTGLAYGLASLGGDVYVNNAISGATEYVSYILCFLVIPGGRKKVYVVLIALGGVGLIASAIVQELLSDLQWAIIFTTMIGRLSVAAGWQILYLWSLELFPTTIRLTMLEISMIVGHIGSALAPLINDLHKLIKDSNIRGEMISPAIYGVLLILSCILAVWLPETNNKPLMVNIDEMALSESTSQKENSDTNIADKQNTSL